MKFIILLLLPCAAFSQKAKIINDTLNYKERRIAVGDTLNIGYGSGESGKFVFITMGSGIGGSAALESQFAKSQVKIDKIYKNSSGIWVRGKVLESNVNRLGGNKVFIEPEGAIDKREID
jgi:hypothetical protein